MKTGNVRGSEASVGAMFEPLEERRLLSASLNRGNLVVGGTRHNDTISVYAGGRHGSFLYVNVNGQSTRFSSAAGQKLSVAGGRRAGHIILADLVRCRSG